MIHHSAGTGRYINTTVSCTINQGDGKLYWRGSLLSIKKGRDPVIEKDNPDGKREYFASAREIVVSCKELETANKLIFQPMG